LLILSLLCARIVARLQHGSQMIGQTTETAYGTGKQ
jgi:hypothetical protein